MRLPAAITEPFQALGCRIGRIGPISFHTPTWNHAAGPWFPPHRWAKASRCVHCGTSLTDEFRPPLQGDR